MREQPAKPNYAVFYLGWVIYTLIGVILVLILFGCSVSRESMTGKEYVRYQQSQRSYDIDKWNKQYRKLNGL